MKDNNHGPEETINQGGIGTRITICPDYGLGNTVLEITAQEKENQSPS